ncbi:MAG: magnesium/cobalt transporter CorA [Fuerstiella sp.]
MLSFALQLPKRITQRFQRRSEPGALPGSVIAHPDASPPIIRVTRYGPDTATECEISDLDHISELVGQSAVTWVDVDGLGDAAVITRIGRQFGFHPLALEDVVNVHQRPKVEMYTDYLFMIARAHPPGGSLTTEQVALFLGRNFVVSFQEREVKCLETVRRRILNGQGRIRDSGADYLLYSLLDAVIDGYFPALEEYGERLDALDERISVREERNLINQIHRVRGELLALRRSVWPLREAVNSLIRDSGTLISEETDLYLRDCYDHTIQIIDVIETDRELCSDLRDFYLTVVSNRMNQVMKLLTIIATLFMPLSFIAGLYGMNFNTAASDWNMPELNWDFGYPFALGLMAATATSLLIFFWRKGWLN